MCLLNEPERQQHEQHRIMQASIVFSLSVRTMNRRLRSESGPGAKPSAMGPCGCRVPRSRPETHHARGTRRYCEERHSVEHEQGVEARRGPSGPDDPLAGVTIKPPVIPVTFACTDGDAIDGVRFATHDLPDDRLEQRRGKRGRRRRARR